MQRLQEVKLKHTGINAPHEEPSKPDIIIDTDKMSPENAADQIINYLKEKKCM